MKLAGVFVTIEQAWNFVRQFGKFLWKCERGFDTGRLSVTMLAASLPALEFHVGSSQELVASAFSVDDILSLHFSDKIFLSASLSPEPKINLRRSKYKLEQAQTLVRINVKCKPAREALNGTNAYDNCDTRRRTRTSTRLRDENKAWEVLDPA